MRETKPGFGKTFWFRLFWQVSVLFAHGLNGFCLCFEEEKNGKKGGKSFKIQKKIPPKKLLTAKLPYKKS